MWTTYPFIVMRTLSLNTIFIHRSDVPEDGHSRTETKKWALSLPGEVSHGLVMYCTCESGKKKTSRKCWRKDLQKQNSISHTAVCSQTALPVRHWSHINPYRVFVLADPEVFSGSLGQVLLGDIEASASGGFLSPLDLMRNVVQHTIQAALGSEQCKGLKLAQALKVSETT